MPFYSKNRDPFMKKTERVALADQFMVRALKAAPGEWFWIEHEGPKARKLAAVCAERVIRQGGLPLLIDSGSDVLNARLPDSSEQEIAEKGTQALDLMKKMQGYIRVTDDADLARIRVSPEKMKSHKRAMTEVMRYRMAHLKWLVVSAPTVEFARACGMTKKAFDQFYLNACLVNYGTMAEAVQPLQKLMEKTEEVRIYSPSQETDLTLGLVKRPVVPCVGQHNLPDGECYTAPARESLNGVIKFCLSNYEGHKFQHVKLWFKDGQVVDAQAENKKKTREIENLLSTDDGARYVGEFALNFNPMIFHPTGDILFDEKINGGLHLALGLSPPESDNGNRSGIHWDLVHIQRRDYGGGQLFFNRRLVRENGLFVLKRLRPLNPRGLTKRTVLAMG